MPYVFVDGENTENISQPLFQDEDATQSRSLNDLVWFCFFG